MRPSSRAPINKSRGASAFRRATSRTAKLNVAAPMRGGIRL